MCLALDNPVARAKYRRDRNTSLLSTMSRYDQEITETAQDLLKSLHARGAWYTTERLMVIKSVVSYHHAMLPRSKGENREAKGSEESNPKPPEEWYWMLLPIVVVYDPSGDDSGGSSNSGSGGSGKRSWSCAACTFENDNPLGLACAVCGTLRVT